MDVRVIHGDCLEVLKQLKENSVDAIVTDPPYGLSFMGKKWDYSVPKVGLWREVLRVLKPGGHLLSFGGTRTYHRMVVAIEDAGFEIRDQVMWLYGSGFPKSHNIGEGRGTALKPANEPIVLARKPLEKGLTVAENVLKWGTGAINVGASRIGTEQIESGRSGSPGFCTPAPGGDKKFVQGRWPANLLLDESAAEMLDAQVKGKLHAAGNKKPARMNDGSGMFGSGKAFAKEVNFKDFDGGASRFFYVAKASKRERGEGNSHPTVKPIKLMEYLCKLITPSGGIILDPFMGSGSTGVAAKRLGFQFIGIEMEEQYVQIAEKRIASV